MPKKTLNEIKESGNSAVLQVKGNQPKLLKDCKDAGELNSAVDIYEEEYNKERNRIEKRTVELFTDFKITSKDQWGNHIKVIVKVTRYCSRYNAKTKEWKDNNEIAYFISSSVFSAEFFCEIIRSHWGIENSNHYVRDVTLKEDKSRIRKNANIMAKIRSFTLNILRINKVTEISKELWENILCVEKIFNYYGV